MYTNILVIHALFKWMVLLTLVIALYRAYMGYFFSKPFARFDNAIRHWTATIAHIQLIFGLILYSQSAITKYFWNNFNEAIKNLDTTFFGLIHLLLMLTAITILTIGSALAKRKNTDAEKFKTMMIWFTIALIIILIAIPWPFSPLASRPYLRTF